MKREEMDKKTKDTLYALTKAGISSMPIVGAAASEILQLLVTPPIEKRKAEWMTDIGDRLKKLEDKEVIDLESLRENETFIDVVIQTTQQALKTSENEKINYYKNAIINTAIGEHPEKSKIQIFLNLVSDFTVWHVKILGFFDDPTDWFSKNEKQFPNFTVGGLSNILENAFPELKEKREFYNLIWNDLYRAGLHKTSGLQTTMTGSGLKESRTTEFGKDFLEFISEHPDE